MGEREEKKNQQIGLLSSLGIHVAMLALFVFVMGWRAPNPPLSEYGSGIELNFGVDQEGSGDIQPSVPVGTNEESSLPEKKVDEDQKQEEQKVIEEVKPDSKVEDNLSSPEESPVEVKETKKELKPAKELTDKPVETKSKEVVAETRKEEKKSVKQPEVIKTPGEEKKGSPGPSHGDDKGKTGDKGKPEGALDAKALYGKAGNGGGAEGGGGGGGIDVIGFEGFERPTIAKPEIPNESYGTYSFAVKVSKEGEVISIKPITKGTSLEAERIFKQTIENTEFVSKVSSLPAQSEGVITFRVIPPPVRKD